MALAIERPPWGPLRVAESRRPWGPPRGRQMVDGWTVTAPEAPTTIPSRLRRKASSAPHGNRAIPAVGVHPPVRILPRGVPTHPPASRSPGRRPSAISSRSLGPTLSARQGAGEAVVTCRSRMPARP